jgi:hypothetical protein
MSQDKAPRAGTEHTVVGRVVSVYDERHVAVRVGQDTVFAMLLPNSKTPRLDDQIVVLPTQSQPLGVILYAPAISVGPAGGPYLPVKRRDNWIFENVTATDDYPNDKTTFVFGVEPASIEWQLKDAEASTTGNRDGFQVPYACNIVGVEVGNPLGVNCTTAINIRRTTDANWPGTWDGSPLNPSPFGPSAATKYSDNTLTGWTIALAKGDWVRVEITTADGALPDLVVVLKVQAV